MKILVTGGNGFIGTHVVEALASASAPGAWMDCEPAAFTTASSSNRRWV